MSAAPTKKFLAGCIASTDPIVTVSKREPRLPVGLASFDPARFEGKPSLHFVGLTWAAELEGAAAAIATDIAQARSQLPQARFVMMASSASESVAFSQAGVPNVLASELLFIDERLFTPASPAGGRTHRYDAVYTARLTREKRHELATAVPRLVLMYDEPGIGDVERVKKILPHAVFANHEMNGGVYHRFDKPQLRDLIVQSSVGLCLSAVEGAMRASLEYRLCGLPVVSTTSIGGRDRYLLGPHQRVVDDDPDAVAAAVAELKAQNIDPISVREFVGQLVAFDRHNFLTNVNKIVERELGVRDRFRSFAPFVRNPVTWRTPEQVFAPFDA